MTSAAVLWTEKRNLTRPSDRETLIYILGRLSRGESLPRDILVLLAEHPQMWNEKNPTSH